MKLRRASNKYFLELRTEGIAYFNRTRSAQDLRRLWIGTLMVPSNTGAGIGLGLLVYSLVLVSWLVGISLEVRV